MLLPVQVVKCSRRTVICVLAAALLAGGLPFSSDAKSYSSGGGRSYSSHSSGSGSSHRSNSSSSRSSSSSSSRSSGSAGSRSSSGGSTHSASSGSGSRSTSSGGDAGKSHGTTASHESSSAKASGKSCNSGSGKSYSSGSTWSDSERHSYTSAKSYSSGAAHTFTSTGGTDSSSKATSAARKPQSDSSNTGFTFDQAAARARKEEVSRAKFAQFKESQLPPPAAPTDVPRPPALSETARSTPDVPSYRVKPPPLPVSSAGADRPVVYVPDAGTLSSRPVRIYTVFNPYASRPEVVYRDPYNSLFWWWLLDRSLDDRAYWTYHHRHDMDPARYQALVASDHQLEARVEQLEAQQAPRDPAYVPPGVDRDMMYSDHYVQQTYSNRPTPAGVFAFWLLAVPTAVAVCGFFIWLIWFKHWQTAT
jgi:hypothetical protein